MAVAERIQPTFRPIRERRLRLPSHARKLILLVGGDLHLIASIRDALDGGRLGMLTTCFVEDFTRRLRILKPDLILLSLPESGAAETLRFAMARATDSAIMTILEPDRPDLVRLSVKLGAQGYLMKPVNRPHLLARLHAELFQR